MAQVDASLTTGIGGIDRMLKGLIPGDNIVWRIDDVEAYRPVVVPYCRAAERIGQPLIYFRFGEEPPLVPEDVAADVQVLDPDAGFESFVARIHKTIERTGRGGYYVFDCVSDLADAWYSDQMLGNWFMLTCPYLYDVEAIAYFALRRNTHSNQAVGAICETTQILLDVYDYDSKLYVHPWKVQSRHSRTMHMLHVCDGEDFEPVTASATISEVRNTVPWARQESITHQLGLWNRSFSRAQDLEALPAEAKEDVQDQIEACRHSLLRMVVSRDEPVLKLAVKYLTLGDIVEIGKRMIGTGLIGGKSVGMLLARAILRGQDPRWAKLLEPHDSFFVGSDVFYSYIVRNGIWWMRERREDTGDYLHGAERARQRMLIGTFPDGIGRQFEDMLDYFGQSPIIVRSSSLLEDNFGNAFAGKYESVFCANQGSRHQRLEDFLAAVRTIYASTMSEKALVYRKQRGLLDHDEQMALLVQRVSGTMHDNLFFPEMAGVAFSFNPYVWSDEIDPETGMMRLVFGLGTRAVDRSDDDYTRVVALNAPNRRPEVDFDEVKRYSQKKVDVLDLTSNQLLSHRFRDVLNEVDTGELHLDVLASRDEEMERRAAAAGVGGAFPYVLTFEKLFKDTPFVTDVREMLSVLQDAYGWPVDVEFTANFVGDGHKVNLVQCRPLQVQGGGAITDPPDDIPEDREILRAAGAVIGPAQITRLDRIVYVVPDAYSQLSIRDRHGVARLIGELCHLDTGPDRPAVMLVGPGRWGTTTPSLGVPVKFFDINTVRMICEVVAMGPNVVPDVSLGTHFFSEMIEMDILYFAMFPARAGTRLNHELLNAAPNRLAELLPGAAKWGEVVRVIDAEAGEGTLRPIVNANPLKQKVVCYLTDDRDGPRFKAPASAKRPAPAE